MAEQDLARLGQERERLVQRIAEIDEGERQLREYLKAVASLIEQDPKQGLAIVGITKLCRRIIDDSHRWVTSQEVRATLEEMGIDISSSYKNPTSVLHKILHRVAACHRDAEGRLYFGSPDLIRPPGSGRAPSARLGSAVLPATKSLTL